MLKKLLARIVGNPKPKKGARKKPAARKPASRKTALSRTKKKPLEKTPAKKTPPRKPGQKSTKPAEKEIGRVVAFFRIPVVAVIRVTQGTLKSGERIWIRGHTTNLKLTIASMQIDHQPIPAAKKGQEVGVKISSRARLGDRVYRLPS